MKLVDSALRLAASQVSLALGLVDADTPTKLRDVLGRLNAIRRVLAGRSDGVHLALDGEGDDG